MKAEQRAFYCGFAAALGTLARDHDEPSVAVNIMNSNGVTLKMLREAGVDRFDLDPLRAEWRAQSPRRRRRSDLDGQRREGQTEGEWVERGGDE